MGFQAVLAPLVWVLRPPLHPLAPLLWMSLTSSTTHFLRGYESRSHLSSEQCMTHDQLHTYVVFHVHSLSLHKIMVPHLLIVLLHLLVLHMSFDLVSSLFPNRSAAGDPGGGVGGVLLFVCFFQTLFEDFGSPFFRPVGKVGKNQCGEPHSFYRNP